MHFKYLLTSQKFSSSPKVVNAVVQFMISKNNSIYMSVHFYYEDHAIQCPGNSSHIEYVSTTLLEGLHNMFTNMEIWLCCHIITVKKPCFKRACIIINIKI